MSRNSGGERRAREISKAILGGEVKVTPTMRRRVGDLALWLSEGDRSKVKENTQLVLDLLVEAARTEPEEPVPKKRRR